jgi:two-component system, OmpR family, sensor histidine kinase PrrB
MRRRSPRLRTQLVLGVAVLVAAILGLAGLAIVVSMDRQDRHRLDDQLEAQADKVLVDYDKTFAVDPDKQDSHDDPVNTLLAGSPSLVRVVSETSVIAQRGDIPVDTVPIPSTLGFATIQIGKEPWRSYVVDIASTDYRLQVLSSLSPVERRFHDNRRLVAAITGIATALAALGSWIVSGLVLRPLERLTRGAHRLTNGLEGSQNLPEVRRPREVSELSVSLNSMLTRQRDSIDATRRFTADAGHELRTPLTALGADLETLRRNPAMSDTQRDEILTAMSDDHRSVVELLDGLQTLARGDAHALPATTDLDIAELVGQCIDQARRRHPDHTFTTGGDLDREVIVRGWPDGLTDSHEHPRQRRSPRRRGWNHRGHSPLDISWRRRNSHRRQRSRHPTRRARRGQEPLRARPQRSRTRIRTWHGPRRATNATPQRNTRSEPEPGWRGPTRHTDAAHCHVALNDFLVRRNVERSSQ